MSNVISNLWNLLFGRKYNKILMVGLEATGKTTILYWLKLGELSFVPISTAFCNIETIKYKNNSFTIWDFGSRGRLKHFWKFYFDQAQALIFVIDSTDLESITNAWNELVILVDGQRSDVVLLIFANKQDLPNAISTAELAEKLRLNNLRGCRWYIQSSCATQGQGLYEGLDWLGNELAKIGSPKRSR